MYKKVNIEGNICASFCACPSSQVSQQEEGEWETHPSVYCTALIWGEGEGRYWPLPLTDGPHALCVCP